ncbi:unnamed protein product [Cuscuta epithymum]|uniref:Uncharacterized protein n=1 Tax=Cuscuta epithymum TaxID=186058 RepID=A0AAV0CJL0_9ASTE|nr:unnamed protein product [Cuscuta epithymum]
MTEICDLVAVKARMGGGAGEPEATLTGGGAVGGLGWKLGLRCEAGIGSGSSKLGWAGRQSLGLGWARVSLWDRGRGWRGRECSVTIFLCSPIIHVTGGGVTGGGVFVPVSLTVIVAVSLTVIVAVSLG